jgi:ABC-type glycerol-3-phosphate transport system permease component
MGVNKLRAVRPSTPAPPRRRLRASTVRALLVSLILFPISVLWIYPLLWMVSASLKTNKEIFSGLDCCLLTRSGKTICAPGSKRASVSIS